MAALVGNLTSVWRPFDWTLLFARQPEPDLEFTEEELDQTIATKARGPLNPRKKPSGGSPILWVLLLALVGGIGYVSMEPELLTEWLGPYLGESTPPPPVTMRPKPAAPAPMAPPAPAPQAAPSPNTAKPQLPWLQQPLPPLPSPLLPQQSFHQPKRQQDPVHQTYPLSTRCSAKDRKSPSQQTK